MTGQAAALAAAVACLGTALLTLGLRAALVRRSILDIPNERSSHAVPVPRGGGLAFVVPCCMALLAAALAGTAPAGALAAALAIAGVAAIGLADDVRGVRPAVRLVVHLACGALAMWAVAPAVAPLAGVGTWAAVALLAVTAAWCVNMVNFMDGIDGIAGAEGAFVLAAAGILAMRGGGSGCDPVTCAALTGAASVAGFTAVNVSPLRIFMGDCGSGALGLAVAWLLAAAVASGELSPWSALALPAAFTCDAGVTLLRRVVAGQSPVAAHRTHAYQRLVRRGFGHRQVSAWYLATNVFIVLPVAWLAGSTEGSMSLVLVLGLHVALAAVAWAVGAGTEPAPSLPGRPAQR